LYASAGEGRSEKIVLKQQATASKERPVMTSAMTRADLTEKLLGIKRENGWSWKHICAEIGGMSPVPYTDGAGYSLVRFGRLYCGKSGIFRHE
jgi:hypothetical protein